MFSPFSPELEGEAKLIRRDERPLRRLLVPPPVREDTEGFLTFLATAVGDGGAGGGGGGGGGGFGAEKHIIQFIQELRQI